MRFGLSSYTYPWAVGIAGSPPSRPLGAAELVARAAALGVPVVQLADNLPLDRLGSDELDAFERAATAAGVRVEVGTRGIGPGLVEYARLAERFGAAFVRVVLDAGDDRPSLDEAWRRLSELEGEFRSRGLTLAIENHDRFTTAELASLVERLGSWAGICLDTVNSFGALEPPEAVIRTLAPLTVNVHLKDFTIRRHRHQLGFEIEGAPAGSGRLDIPFLLDEVGARGRAGSAILELWTPPAATVDETVEREADWAVRSIAYLRQFTSLEFAPPAPAAAAAPSS